MQQVLMYSRFERLWHWSQAMLVITLLITGFEIHGSYLWLGFETAVNTHIIAAWSLIGIWFLGVFWHMVTGEWKQYIPSSSNRLIAMVKYYGIDIFVGGALVAFGEIVVIEDMMGVRITDFNTEE